jgi:hypothetical protein
MTRPTGRLLGQTDRQALEARLGPLLSARDVMSHRRLSPADLAERVADGRLITVALPPHGALAFPAYQFSRNRAPGTVLAARQAFRSLDPSGALAASWLTSSVAPPGWLWRDVDAYLTFESGFEIVTQMASLDAHRYSASLQSPQHPQERP